MTKKMPLMIWRSLIRGLPPLDEVLERGKIGSIACHWVWVSLIGTLYKKIEERGGKEEAGIENMEY
jgi:hypothetical protein